MATATKFQTQNYAKHLRQLQQRANEVVEKGDQFTAIELQQRCDTLRGHCGTLIDLAAKWGVDTTPHIGDFMAIEYSFTEIQQLVERRAKPTGFWARLREAVQRMADWFRTGGGLLGTGNKQKLLR